MVIKEEMNGRENFWERFLRVLFFRKLLRKEGVIIKVEKGVYKKVEFDNLILSLIVFKYDLSWKITYKIDLRLDFSIGVRD